MKAFLLLTLVLVIFQGCKKRSLNDHDLNALQGTWELRKIIGGITLEYPEHNGNFFKFTKNGYELYANDTLFKKGTYSIVTDNIAIGSECGPSFQGIKSEHQRIIYDGKIDSVKEVIEITSGLLKLTSGCFALDYGVEKQFVKK